MNGTNFNRTDPLYGQDIGFYLFQFPFYRGLQSWLFNLLVIGLIVAITVYLLKGIFKLDVSRQKVRLENQWQSYFPERQKSLENEWQNYFPEEQKSLEPQWQNHHQEKQKTHISLLLAAIAITIAVDFWLKRYDLLYSAQGVVWGAGSSVSSSNACMSMMRGT